MRVDLVAGITPVSVGSVEQTAHELTDVLARCRAASAGPDLGVHVSAREVAELAHRTAAGLLAVVEHPAADPALLLGVLTATVAPLGQAPGELRDHLAGESGPDVRELVEGRSTRGYPVVFVERIVTEEQLAAGEPFDCQLQAVVADPAQPRLAVFTLSSTTGRGWLALSGVLGRLVASIDFGD